MKRSTLLAGIAILLIRALPANAQPVSLGKGWLLGTAGAVTTAPEEVLAGHASIKGALAGGNGPFFLHTDPSHVHFAPNQTYTIR